VDGSGFRLDGRVRWLPVILAASHSVMRERITNKLAYDTMFLRFSQATLRIPQQFVSVDHWHLKTSGA
jgi:hypothetical protein